jgi:hypothetical protein
MVAVFYVAFGGTAIQGLDYTLPPGALVFAPGATSQTIPLSIKNVGQFRPSETLHILLYSPFNAVLGNNVIETYTITNNDAAPSVNFAVGSSSGREAAGLASLQVTLSAAARVPVSVDFVITGGSAKNGGVDYFLFNNTLTFLPGQTSANIVFAVTNDLLNEDNETIQLGLTNPINAILGTTNPTETYTILENDPQPFVYFPALASSAQESATEAVVAVALSAPSGRTVTVGYGVPTDGTGGSAKSGSDYVLNNGSLTFAPGHTVQYIPMQLIAQSGNEANKTVGIDLSSPNNAVLLPTNLRFIFTILNDVPPPRINFNVPSASGNANGQTVAIEVDLTAASNQTVTVNYIVVGGTAKNGTDYTLAPGTLTFTPTVTSQSIQMPVANNASFSGTKTVVIELYSPFNGLLGPGIFFTYSIGG